MLRSCEVSSHVRPEMAVEDVLRPRLQSSRRYTPESQEARHAITTPPRVIPNKDNQGQSAAPLRVSESRAQEASKLTHASDDSPVNLQRYCLIRGHVRGKLTHPAEARGKTPKRNGDAATVASCAGHRMLLRCTPHPARCGPEREVRGPHCCHVAGATSSRGVCRRGLPTRGVACALLMRGTHRVLPPSAHTVRENNYITP